MGHYDDTEGCIEKFGGGWGVLGAEDSKDPKGLCI